MTYTLKEFFADHNLELAANRPGDERKRAVVSQSITRRTRTLRLELRAGQIVRVEIDGSTNRRYARYGLGRKI
jgi:hypothetical protein